MFVSCTFVNVCVKRNGNRKEGGREERAERDTCSDTETERRDEKERERKNLVSTRNTAPLPLSLSFLPACGGLNGVARCRGAHIRTPCPQRPLPPWVSWRGWSGSGTDGARQGGDEGCLCGGQCVLRLGQAGELGLGLWSCTWGFNQLFHTKPVSCSYQ